jgi:hypothetical protein
LRLKFQSQRNAEEILLPTLQMELIHCNSCVRHA